MSSPSKEEKSPYKYISTVQQKCYQIYRQTQSSLESFYILYSAAFPTLCWSCSTCASMECCKKLKPAQQRLVLAGSSEDAENKASSSGPTGGSHWGYTVRAIYLPPTSPPLALTAPYSRRNIEQWSHFPNDFPLATQSWRRKAFSLVFLPL